MANSGQSSMASLNTFLQEWHSSEEYITAHTSGSTGKPKEICLLKADMRISARATNTYFSLGKDSRAALPLSLDYIAGKMMAVRAIEGNYPLDILPVSNDIVLPDNRHRYSLLPVVPTQLPSLLKHKEYTKRIDNLLIGGASPDDDMCRTLLNAGYKAYISYGMTETCSHVALCDVSSRERIYRAMPGISFTTDNNQRLIIEAPAFSFKHLMTNDIVELIDTVSFRWRGRFDNAINSGGIKLFPEELEKLYAPYLSGVNFYVTGRQHEKWGECICLVIEGDSDGSVFIESIRKHLDHKICPKCFENTHCLPRTSNGKIRRI